MWYPHAGAVRVRMLCDGDVKWMRSFESYGGAVGVEAAEKWWGCTENDFVGGLEDGGYSLVRVVPGFGDECLGRDMELQGYCESHQESHPGGQRKGQGEG
jgi:hypothetical protein